MLLKLQPVSYTKFFIIKNYTLIFIRLIYSNRSKLSIFNIQLHSKELEKKKRLYIKHTAINMIFKIFLKAYRKETYNKKALLSIIK